jgi:mono/diheme cytochrome c family protein
MVFATAATTIGVIIAVVLIVGWLVYLLWNLRNARAEAGSEVELAPNRKPYLSDEELEGPKLERTQIFGVAMLVVIGVGLPLYWIGEPGRQAGAIEGYNKRFASWGSEDFAPTAEGGFNCAGCHGGMQATGGSAPYTITDPNTGEVVSVTWLAPALNTVMYRFSEDEVRYIINYGRPFSPMSPWGTVGGGPMNEQQVQNVIDYLKSIQVPMEGCGEGELTCETGRLPAGDPAAENANPSTSDEVQRAAQKMVDDGEAASLGEALFNLELSSGAYSCARCHTNGWSYGDPKQSGGGAFGPNLTGGSTVRQFPSASDHIEFVETGSEQGKRYGQQGQGSGRMPGFGQLLTEEQIQAIVDYERGL